MESLYLLIPMAILLVLAICALLAWSVLSGQFDDLDAEGSRIFGDQWQPPADDPQVSDRQVCDRT